MPDHFYVYPAYIGRSRSRALGRRVPAGVALEEVSAEEIAIAARHLGFEATVEAEKQYPREPSAYAGRVKVVKRAGTSKAAFLRQLAEEIRRSPPTVQGA